VPSQPRLARDGDRHVRPAPLRTDVLILACAVSAGIHAALAPDHFGESLGAGLGFVVAAVLLAALAAALTLRPSPAASAAAAMVFAGLLGSYALVVATGFPLLHPEREAVNGLALFAKAVEAAGLVLAVSPLRPLAAAPIHLKGTST
jgi:drug/metabolite transporter (DMT)-like permease